MLFKKLFRTFWVYKAQFISMIIMIGIGVGIFFGFNLEWYSLKVDTDEIYEATGFADFRVINEGGFSKADLDKVTAIEGVTDATRFLSVNTTVQNDTDIVAITVSENTDVNVQHDMLYAFEKVFPRNDNEYLHEDGNSFAHIKSAVVGVSESLIIENGRLILGIWQDLYFCEFDGPRTRYFYVKITEG